MTTKKVKSSVFAYGGIQIAFWTAIIGMLAGYAIYTNHLNTIAEAENVARNYYSLNLFYRAWGARMGGVYVPASKVTPNPYLTVPNRDITSSDGQNLTLVNPAFMTRMVFEDLQKSSPIPIVSKLISSNPLNPMNGPDAWEQANLEAFQRGERSERSEVTTLNGKPYLRLITQFVTERPCLKCHAQQGYKEGDVRGGITISVPLIKPYAQEKVINGKIVGSYLFIWLIGSTGIAFMSHRRHLNENELRESERKFRTICDWTQDWEYWVDPSGSMKYVSPSSVDMTGYRPEEFMADKDLITRIVHPDDREIVDKHHHHTLQHADTDDHQIEFRIITRNGETRWIQHICRQVFIESENMGRRVSNRDITANKAAAAKLEESARQHRIITGTSLDSYWVIDRNGKVVEVNAECSRMYGYSRDELIGMTLRDFEVVEDPEETLAHVNTVINSGFDRFETQHRRKDGSIIDVEVSTSYTPETSLMLAFVRDVTAIKKAEKNRVEMERKLQQTQKLESLGILAGGIAHDFNNILTSIIGNADLALMRINKESPIVQNLHKIEQASSRAADLAKQMLAYSGKGRFVIQLLDVNVLLEEMLHMLEVSISKKAVLRFNLMPSLPSVEADATQMRQIIMNLVINACEAIGDKSGVIAITTGCMDCDKSYLKDVWLNENLQEGLYIYLEIADTGCGMDQETMGKLFDPFFTTKFTGRGLGMAAVLGIVKGHKGAIKVYSEPKKGSTFKILLPASGKPAEIFNDNQHKNDWQGTGTVLLVDDEETIRGIGTEMLKELGFTPITAVDGQEAVETFKITPDIAFVILDLTMPHMDGEQCFRELRRLDPQVKVIMSSGFSEQEVTQKFTGKGLAGFIQKPYKMSVLREVLSGIGQ